MESGSQAYGVHQIRHIGIIAIVDDLGALSVTAEACDPALAGCTLQTRTGWRTDFCAAWQRGWPQRSVFPALVPAQGCLGPAPKSDRPSRCRWGLAPPERLRAFRSPRSYNPLFQPVEIWGGLLGAAFPRPWPEYGKKFACTVTLQQALKWARRIYLGPCF